MTGFPILWTVLGIGFLIFVHELGHYLAARLARVRVEVFSLGFGPRLFGAVIGDTDYRISLVPLGGYVKVAGDDPTDRRFLAPDDLHAKGFLARTFFFSAGVLMNMLFAIVAFPLVFNSGVEFTAPIVGDLQRGSPAWEADLRPGDRIARIGSKSTYAFENLQVEVALAGRGETELVIERDGQTIEKRVRPQYSAAQGLLTIGISPELEREAPALTVRKGSAAHTAGLRDEDRIVRVNDVAVAPATLAETVQDLTRGERKELAVTVLRDGQERTFRFVPDLGKVKDPRIGVTPASRRIIGIRAPAPGRLDLRHGDQIATIDGKPFTGPDLMPFADGEGELVITIERESHLAPVVVSARLSAAERRALFANLACGVDERGLVVAPLPGLPALEAGLRAGDTILRVAGQPVRTWSELKQAIKDRQDRAMTLSVRRGAQELDLTLTPRTELVDLGFVAHSRTLKEVYRVEGVGASLRAGLVCSLDLVKQLYVTLKRLVTGDVAASNLGGIIQISVVTYEFAKSGWARFFYFLGLLSINLAFMNVLPIPILDGGHLLFLLVERIKGSPVSARVMNYGQIVGLVFLIALMVFVTFNDIRRLL